MGKTSWIYERLLQTTKVSKFSSFFFLTCVPSRTNLYEMGSASKLIVATRGMRHILHHLQQLFTLKRN